MTKKPRPTVQTSPNGAIFYGDPLPYPISRAVRAGDFVITSGFGDRVPLAEEQVYAADGTPLSTGARRKMLTFAEEVHGTFRSIIDALALADCSLADVVDAQVWLKDPRDFHELNRIYADYFTRTRPIRTVFQNAFMMEFRIEMKVVAYKPLG
jgi:enamine deaminase RidA (YjgF/YER057c/UK114 family)